MLKVFTSPMCGPCHILKNRIKASIEEGRDIPEHEIIDTTKMDKAEMPEGIRSIPTVYDTETGEAFTGIQAASERLGVK